MKKKKIIGISVEADLYDWLKKQAILEKRSLSGQELYRAAVPE